MVEPTLTMSQTVEPRKLTPKMQEPQQQELPQREEIPQVV